MSQNYPSIINAAGAVTGANGSAIWGAGAASARTSAGVYTLTLDEPSDSLACAVLVTIRGAVPAIALVAQTSDTVKTVSLFDPTDGTTPVDASFDYLVLRAPLS